VRMKGQSLWRGVVPSDNLEKRYDLRGSRGALVAAMSKQRAMSGARKWN